MLRGPLPIACAVLALSACRGSDGSTRDTAGALPSSGPVVRLEKSGCFGPCPVYTVEVDARGNVSFEGRAFVGSYGKQTGKIEADAVVALARSLEDDDFYAVVTVAADKCEKGTSTDNPTYAITLATGGRERRISEYLGSNCRLERIIGWADRIEQTLSVAPWLKCDGPCTRSPGDPDTSGDGL